MGVDFTLEKPWVVLAVQRCHLLGREFLSVSLVCGDILSGKAMSKEMRRSPLLVGSLDWGRPLPTIRLTVDGLMTSSVKLNTSRSLPVSVGTSTLTPHKA